MLRLRLSMTESTCRPLAKKKNPLKTCWREQKYNFRAMMRRDHKSHLGSPQDDNDKDVSMCVQTLREIGWIASQWELHTFYLFWRGFHWWKPRKTAGGGVVYLPPEKTKTDTSLFFEFWGRRFKLAKFHRNRWIAWLPSALVERS